MFILHFCISSLGGFYIKVNRHHMESKTGSLHDFWGTVQLCIVQRMQTDNGQSGRFSLWRMLELNPARTCFVHHLHCNLSFDWIKPPTQFSAKLTASFRHDCVITLQNVSSKSPAWEVVKVQHVVRVGEWVSRHLYSKCAVGHLDVVQLLTCTHSLVGWICARCQLIWGHYANVRVIDRSL